jgi:outer membrane receptor protein involved in Fe transport
MADAQSAIDEIVVVAGTPLGESQSSDLAGNYQTIDSEEFRRQRALDLTEMMNRRLGSVFINEAQSNPLQPDVQYRGFVGSPLLGLPQGIAVYQDGVRVNEPFGDTVNWALIPGDAINTLQLLPGSNPVFGLNALGGTISIKTKDGFSNPGTLGKAMLGSFSRQSVQAETGGQFSESLAYFATASYLEEDGWRDYSGTRAVQTFGSLTWRSDRSKLDSKLTYVDSDLTGNGSTPVQLLQNDRSAIFTHPDDTSNELVMLNLIATHELSSATSLAGNIYVRSSDISTLNGDDSDVEPCQDDPAVLCDEDDAVLDADGSLIPTDDRFLGATINRTETQQDGLGISLQLESRHSLGNKTNHFVAGVAFDHSEVAFLSATELGSLDASRGAVSGGVFVGDAFTKLDTESSNSSIFFSDSLRVTVNIRFGLAGRFNRTETRLRDGIGTALNGDHVFERFNPSVSASYRLGGSMLYARYSESSRVPSPVELTCADPDAPCRLPNAFLADPPLEMIVAETLEVGIRGRNEFLEWHAGLFHTLTEDDILFISAGALTNQGFFDNIGQTKRVGLELNLTGSVSDTLHWFFNYTRLKATFEDSLIMSSPNNPRSVDGEILVSKGDRLPLIPEHLLKAGITWVGSGRLRLGADLQGNSNSFLRGDEGNDTPAMDGYMVLNANAAYQVNDHLQVFLSIVNVLNSEYESFGLFGDAENVLGDDFDNSRFLSPGTPRAAWIGFELSR